MIHQTKTIQVSNNLLANLLICQTFFHQMLEKSQFAKLSHYTVMLTVHVIVQYGYIDWYALMYSGSFPALYSRIQIPFKLINLFELPKHYTENYKLQSKI